MARITVDPILLSGSTSGRGIKIAATATPGTLLHTAHATKTDRIWLSVTNSHSATVEITIQWGGTTSPDDETRQTIKFRSGEELLIAGRLLTGGLVVRAFASVADKLIISGEVERITSE